MAVDVMTSWKVAGHHRSAARRANSRGHSEAVEIGPLFSQTVNVWGFDIGVPVATQITPAPIVGKDKENIGLFLLRLTAQAHANSDNTALAIMTIGFLSIVVSVVSVINFSDSSR